MRVSWQSLYDEIYACEKCELCRHIHNKVPGQGDVNARLMFIGEGPGADEDAQGLAFVGAAGQLLTKMIAAMGMTREQVYICNIVKCRPPMNRDPSDDEQDACIGYLKEQIRLIDPKIIVCLGRIAAKRIMTPDFKITAAHGDWMCIDGVWHMAMYHPSALLRDVYKRPDTFEDLLSIRKKLKEVHAKL